MTSGGAGTSKLHDRAVVEILFGDPACEQHSETERVRPRGGVRRDRDRDRDLLGLPRRIGPRGSGDREPLARGARSRDDDGVARDRGGIGARDRERGETRAGRVEREGRGRRRDVEAGWHAIDLLGLAGRAEAMRDAEGVHGGFAPNRSSWVT